MYNVSVITDDFSARSSSKWSEDINTSEGTKLYSLTSSNGFTKLTNEPTHMQRNNFSCIDLIFTDQPNLSVNSGVHASLRPNCHHQIVHTKFNLSISYSHHSSVLYGITKRQTPQGIRKALNSVNWERLFSKKDTDAQVAVFNKSILNVSRNYVSNKYITIDDKDLRRMNEAIKSKNNMCNKHIENRRFESDFLLLITLITELTELINTTKVLYYQNLSKKLILYSSKNLLVNTGNFL